MTKAFDPSLFSEYELDLLLNNIDKLSERELEEVSRIVDELDRRKRVQAARDDLLAFCQHMQPDYKIGKHHRILAGHLMRLEKGDEDRICVNIPPRHGKSQLVSIYYPAWFIGRNPNKKVMTVSHTADLAVDFGRQVRNLIDTPEYKQIFPSVALAADSKSAGRWNTNFGGVYFATGVGSSLAGRGADLLIVDDPHSEQDVLAGNFEVFEKAYKWFTFGARTRLMPGGRVAVVQTRWHMDDLTGRLVKDMGNSAEGDQYKVVEFPAILDTDKGKKALWPEQYPLADLLRTKASMPLFQWNAQYQQNPTSEEGAVIKNEWWREWTHRDPPDIDYIIMSLDAAAEAKNRADYSALTTWGVFKHEKITNNTNNIILLNSIKRRVEFPELKEICMKEYKDYDVDTFIVEKKSNAVPLFQELRRAGIPVVEFTPSRGTGDKLARLNSVSDIIRSGFVWVPQTRWAEELREELGAFPFGSHDDLVDSTVLALMRFRQGGFLELPTDYVDNDADLLRYRPPVEYY